MFYLNNLGEIRIYCESKKQYKKSRLLQTTQIVEGRQRCHSTYETLLTIQVSLTYIGETYSEIGGSVANLSHQLHRRA